jgi:hypothetical protein
LRREVSVGWEPMPIGVLDQSRLIDLLLLLLLLLTSLTLLSFQRVHEESLEQLRAALVATPILWVRLSKLLGEMKIRV